MSDERRCAFETSYGQRCERPYRHLDHCYWAPLPDGCRDSVLPQPVGGPTEAEVERAAEVIFVGRRDARWSDADTWDRDHYTALAEAALAAAASTGEPPTGGGDA